MYNLLWPYYNGSYPKVWAILKYFIYIMKKNAEQIFNISTNEEARIQNLRNKLLNKIGIKLYKSWFTHNIISWGNYYYLQVPNEFIKDMIVIKFHRILKELNVFVEVKKHKD